MSMLRDLIAARAVIASPDHWTIGIKNSGDGRHCALGAIDAAVGLGARSHEVALVLAAAMTDDQKRTAVRYFLRKGDDFDLRSVFFSPESWVAQYNNATDHASVLTLFDRAIEQQRVIEGMAVREEEMETVS